MTRSPGPGLDTANKAVTPKRIEAPKPVLKAVKELSIDTWRQHCDRKVCDTAQREEGGRRGRQRQAGVAAGALMLLAHTELCGDGGDGEGWG